MATPKNMIIGRPFSRSAPGLNRLHHVQRSSSWFTKPQVQRQSSPCTEITPPKSTPSVFSAFCRAFCSQRFCRRPFCRQQGVLLFHHFPRCTISCKGRRPRRSEPDGRSWAG